MNKLTLWWNSLPHYVQVLIMAFLGAAGGVLKHQLADPNACFAISCLKGYAISACHAGLTAVIALEVPSNWGK